jgi:CxxC-x17-CxxC domain-containing protein
MTNQENQLICRDCGKKFEFTPGEKAFFASRGFPPPSRCPECRKAKKAQRGNHSANTGSPSRPVSDGQMYQITCSVCKKTTEVPFKPRNTEGILCSDCFMKKANG